MIPRRQLERFRPRAVDDVRAAATNWPEVTPKLLADPEGDGSSPPAILDGYPAGANVRDRSRHVADFSSAPNRDDFRVILSAESAWGSNKSSPRLSSPGVAA